VVCVYGAADGRRPARVTPESAAGAVEQIDALVDGYVAHTGGQPERVHGGLGETGDEAVNDIDFAPELSPESEHHAL
jgi:hypothetical protein